MPDTHEMINRNAKPVGLLISIVAYNTWEDIGACVESILLNRGEQSLQISIWNNGDDAPAWWHSRFQEHSDVVELRGCGRNLGFGRGHNRNILSQRADYVLVLNPDTLLTPTSLHQCLELLQSKSKAVAVAPALVDLNGNVERSLRRIPSPLTEMSRAVGLDYLFNLGTVDRKAEYAQPGPVQQPPGAALFMSMDIYRRLGGFDEDFLMYFEDVDLCTRLLREGEVWYQPAAQIIHSREGTAKKYRLETTFWIEYSRRIYVNKHFGALRIPVLVASILGAALRGLALLLISLMPSDMKPNTEFKKAAGYLLSVCSFAYGSKAYWARRLLGMDV